MKRKGKISTMLIPTLIMGILAFIMLGIGFYRREGQHIVGVKSAMTMVVQITPLLIFAFIVAGMIQVLIPHDLIMKWVGVESGMRGILLGSLACTFIFPPVAGLIAQTFFKYS